MCILSFYQVGIRSLYSSQVQ